MATQATKSNGVAVVNNDLGVVRHGGTIAGSRFNSAALGDTDNLKGGSVVVDNSQVDPILAAGEFAKTRKGEYVIMKNTPKLANLASTTLRGGAADLGHRQKFHNIEAINMTFLQQRAWNANKEGAPTYTDTYATGKRTFFSIKDGAAQTPNDDATAVTAARPGELTYRTGAFLPKNDAYKKKTST